MVKNDKRETTQTRGPWGGGFFARETLKPRPAGCPRASCVQVSVRAGVRCVSVCGSVCVCAYVWGGVPVHVWECVCVYVCMHVYEYAGRE